MQTLDYIVTENESVIETMKVIEKGARSIAFVCDDKKLLAAVSDGDIRRHLIQNGDMSIPVSKIANYQPIFLYADSEIDIKQFMRERFIQALPIVDSEKNIIRIVFERKEVLVPKQELSLPVVIMAGGKGTRLEPYTQILPKPLIPIGEKTITEHIMERFEQFGCSNFDMIVNYKKNFIQSYFGDNDIDHHVNFVEEPEFWGTAGGLTLLRGRYNKTFFVTNCDILIDADYQDIYNRHKEQENMVTIVCAKKRVVIPYGTIHLSSDQVTGLEEKPKFDFVVNTGLYLVEPEFLDRIPDATFIHITEVIQRCIEMGDRVGTYLVDEDAWMDMGQLEELEKMKRKMEIK